MKMRDLVGLASLVVIPLPLSPTASFELQGGFHYHFLSPPAPKVLLDAPAIEYSSESAAGVQVTRYEKFGSVD
jgi:hypothetical protein